MIRIDADWVWLAFHLGLATIGVFLLVMGTRAVVTRRLPRPRLRFGDQESNRLPQPVRIGGLVASVGAMLLLQQAWFLLPVARPAGFALSLLAFLVMVGGVAWFVMRRD